MQKTIAVITPLALAAALLGGCGGGSSPAEPTPPAAAFVGVALTGTAATGAALASAKVEAQCATGAGVATSAADGSYTLKIDGAALPCLLRATSADAATVLHSLAEGTGSTGDKAATANISPLTELVIARAAGSGSSPAAAYSAKTAFTASQLSEAKAAVIGALKATTDLTGIDPLTTAFRAATTGVAGDATDKKLDALMAALATAKLPLARLSNAIVTAADANAASTATAVILSAPPLANCPSLRSGTYAVIGRRGEVFETVLNLGTMHTTDADGSVSTIVASAEGCRFKLFDAQGMQRVDVAFGPEGVGLAVGEANGDGDRATSIVLPKQSLGLAALTGDWVAVEWDRIRAGNLPRFGFATAKLAADGVGVFQGCTQTAGVADCTAAERRNTGNVTINTQGQIVSPGNSLGYAFRASNGSTMIVWGKPNGDGITVLTRSAASALPAAGSTRKVWESFGTSTAARPDTFVAGSMGQFDIGFSGVNGSAVTLSNGQVLGFNRPLPGLIYRAAGSNGKDSWDESLGLDVAGLLMVMGGNTASSASFGVSLLR